MGADGYVTSNARDLTRGQRGYLSSFQALGENFLSLHLTLQRSSLVDTHLKLPDPIRCSRLLRCTSNKQDVHCFIVIYFLLLIMPALAIKQD